MGTLVEFAYVQPLPGGIQSSAACCPTFENNGFINVVQVSSCLEINMQRQFKLFQTGNTTWDIERVYVLIHNKC